jgi:hypothetical protein
MIRTGIRSNLKAERSAFGCLLYAHRIFFQTIAEIYESDIAEVDKAILHYEKAADYFRVRA